MEGFVVEMQSEIESLRADLLGENGRGEGHRREEVEAKARFDAFMEAKQLEFIEAMKDAGIIEVEEEVVH